MKLMELLVEEQQHMITEDYCLDSGDCVRLSIIQESYTCALNDYQRAVLEYSRNSRQAQIAESKLTTYTKLYVDFVTEMDQHYHSKKIINSSKK